MDRSKGSGRGDRVSPGRYGFGWRDGVSLLAAVAWLTGLALSVPCESRAQAGTLLSVAETEEIVRASYFEGLPVDLARRIGDEGCKRLVELLEDPAEAAHHGTILLALGICGPAGGLEAIENFAAALEAGAGTGEIDRARYRAWQMLPFALGHLAEHDARAIDALATRLESGVAPAWRFRHQRGPRLLNLERRAAASCLADTGLPAARAALVRAERRASDPAFEAHLSDSRRRHARAAEARR